jgi:signal recognition particle subunit SRP9
MVYVNTFDEFFASAQELYTRSPTNTRYSFKYKGEKLVLKVTDDRICLKFRTAQQADVKKLEKISAWFFAQTTGRASAEEEKH